MGNGRESPIPSSFTPGLSASSNIFSALKSYRRLLILSVCLLLLFLHLLYVHFQVDRHLTNHPKANDYNWALIGTGNNNNLNIEAAAGYGQRIIQSNHPIQQLQNLQKEDEKKKALEGNTSELLNGLISADKDNKKENFDEPSLDEQEDQHSHNQLINDNESEKISQDNADKERPASEPHDLNLDINNLPEHDHAHEDESPTESAAIQAARAECKQMLEQYNVVVGSGWGLMEHLLDKQRRWEELYCNKYASESALGLWYKNHPTAYQSIALPANYPRKTNPNPQIPIIAICVCVTTRSLKIAGYHQLSLFTKLIPSFLNFVENDYIYWIYLAYDEGDEYLDNSQHLKDIDEHFQSSVTDFLLQRQIEAKLFHHKFHNEAKRPGPVFNYITEIAVADGADYVYRINDDTEFASMWVTPFIKQLKAFGTPFGVVGPTCHEGNVNILTHDFTHRLHHEIFPAHYPPSLQDWWMDDWISRVYGRSRTLKMGNVKVVHHTGSHGTRYQVDHTHGALLEGEIEEGRKHVEKWLKTQGLKNELDKYKVDEFRFHVKLQ